MSEAPLLLGLDLGTTRTKAVLMDGSGVERGSAKVDTPFVTRAERVEMGVDDLRQAVAHVVARLGPDRDRVAGVGLAGMAESGAAFDVEGRPLGPVIAWHDPRGQEVVDLLQEHFGDDLAIRIGQRLRTVSSVAKVGWLLSHGAPDVRRWLGVPESVAWLLTGAHATEHSLAARTGCYDVTRNSYIPEVAEVVGFPPGVFAGVVTAGQPVGQVSAEGSAWSGLPEGVPVTLAGHDHLAGAVGAKAGTGDLVNSVGTAETVVRRHGSVPDMEMALELGVAVSVFPGGRDRVALASAARAGVVLDRASTALDHSITELDGMVEGRHAGDAAELVKALQAGEEPALPDAPPGEVWASLLHALVQRTLSAVERLTELLGPAQRLLVFGGGSRSSPWMDAKAAAAQLPVWRVTADEVVARGAATFGGVAAGWWPSPEEAPDAPLEEVAGG
ncbi:MAG TPA: FGGY family carbohydrate kinase [Acidimicrobiales bacterium]|nr:FGGY family carbohydrate kinase [Acidimicrobiales bacterium]